MATRPTRRTTLAGLVWARRGASGETGAAETGDSSPNAPTGETGPSDTSLPKDTQVPTDTSASTTETGTVPDDDPTDTDDPLDAAAGDPKEEGGCGCGTGSSGSAWLLAALLPLLLRRRSGAALALLLMAAAVPTTEARAQDLDFENQPAVALNAPIHLSGWDEVELGVITVPDGQRVEIGFASGGINSFELTNRHGRVVADQWHDGLLAPVRLMAGQYLVRVTPAGSTTAVIWAYDDADGTATLDVPASGTIDVAGAEHRYTFASPGGRFVVRSDGAPWRLENAMGPVVRDGAAGVFDLQPGDYVVVVGGPGFTGAYEVTWATARVAVPLTLGTAVTDTLSVGDTHTFTYLASLGEQVELSGVPADARVRVLDPDGVPLLDAMGGGPLAMTLGAGEHELQLIHEGAVDSPYTAVLSATVIAPSGLVLDDQGPLTLGVPLAGGVVAPSAGHVAQLVLAQSTTIRFSVQASAWTLRDPQGQARPVDGPMQLGAGTWTVEVVPPSLPSPYSLLAQQVVADSVRVGTSDQAIITEGMAERWFAFDLPFAARLRFMPDATSHVLDWRLEDVDGAQWFAGDLFGVVGEGVSLPAGSYRLVVERTDAVGATDPVSSSFESAFAEAFDEVVQLGDEMQGAFLEPHGFGVYHVVVPEDDTPFQLSIIETFSFSPELPSTYTGDVAYALLEPYGVVVREMGDESSGTHSEVWVLDAGTYELQLKTPQAPWGDAWEQAEWDLKPRGLAHPDRDIWFGHDDDILGFAGPRYGISRVGTSLDGLGVLQLGAVEDVWPTNYIWS